MKWYLHGTMELPFRIPPTLGRGVGSSCRREPVHQMSTFPYSVRYLGGMFIDVRQIIGEKNARVEATSASTDGRALDSNASVRRVSLSITNNE